PVRTDVSAVPLLRFSKERAMARGTRQRKKAQKPKAARRRAPTRHDGKSAGQWSADVMQRSDALDLDGGDCKKKNALPVARSLRKSDKLRDMVSRSASSCSRSCPSKPANIAASCTFASSSSLSSTGCATGVR